MFISVNQLSRMPESEEYVRRTAGAAAWMLLPLLGKTHGSEVNEACITALRVLIPLDPPFVR